MYSGVLLPSSGWQIQLHTEGHNKPSHFSFQCEYLPQLKQYSARNTTIHQEKSHNVKFPHLNHDNFVLLFLYLNPIFPGWNPSLLYHFVPEAFFPSSLAQAKWSQCWYQRKATSPTQDLWEVPQQTSDGEDLEAAIRLHCAQNQVCYQLNTCNIYYMIYAAGHSVGQCMSVDEAILSHILSDKK